MKQLLGLAALAGLLATPALAQPQSETSAPATVCIDTMRIDHTRTPNNRTILFYMKDGKVWKNTLPQFCSGLAFYGFSYSPTPPHQLCSNMETIRVIHSGSVCMLGAFTPYTPPKKTDSKSGETP